MSSRVKIDSCSHMKGEKYEQVSEAGKSRGQGDDEVLLKGRSQTIQLSSGSSNVEIHEACKLVRSLRGL